MKCWLIYLLLVTACVNSNLQSKDEKDKPVIASPKKDSIVKEEVLTIEPFEENSKSAKGCSGAFAEDIAAFESHSYLIVKKAADKALLKVSGKRILLKLDDKIEDGSIVKEVYKGSGYMLHLIIHKVKPISGGKWLYTGEILLIKNKLQQNKPVVGTTGC